MGWLESPSPESELKLKVHAYEAATEAEIIAAAAAHAGDSEEADNRPVRDMAADILKHCRGHANLIFANSRNDVEQVGEHCAMLAKAQALADKIMVHHGSLSADHRHDTERTMKHASDTGGAATAFCTSTLEMGIDIGNVRVVGQIGPPFSVASLKQRVGRSGRRANTCRILRTYLECDAITDKSSLFDRLQLPLVQTIAVIELLCEHWVEPAESSSFDFSTLTHQIISLIAETGGRMAGDVYGILCERGVFRDVDKAAFIALLRQLGRADVFEQTSQGELILGLTGEDLRKDKRFYAAFPSGEPFVVLHDGRRIGTVDGAPTPEQHMILAGRRWRVVDVDQSGKTVYVIPARGRSRTPFAGGGGNLHPRVAECMRTVLATSVTYPYLDHTASRLLAAARLSAVTSHACRTPLVPLDDETTAVMTWAGTRTTATLRAMLIAKGVDVAGEAIALTMKKSIEETRMVLRDTADAPPAESDVLDALTHPSKAKYDELLDAGLRTQSLKHRWLDLSGGTSLLRELVRAG